MNETIPNPLEQPLETIPDPLPNPLEQLSEKEVEEYIDKALEKKNKNSKLLKKQIKELKVEDFTKEKPNFGEVFIINDETQGACECLEHFKGKQILSFGGGFKKLFVIEDNLGNEGIISSLHAPEFDDYDFTFTEHDEGNQKSPNEIFEAFDNKGPLKKIISGKKHLIFLTGDGKLYSYGFGEYGALGQGGVSVCVEPKLIKSISNKSVIQVACGEFHSLALTNSYDLFSWGRGFEGQLGLAYKVKRAGTINYNFSESVSSPSFVAYFYQQPITQIACGAYHSMAIDWQDRLYGWGEAKLGQVGCGKTMKENKKRNNQYKKARFGEERVKQVSCGYGHTCAVLKDGSVWCWGFNVKGQLGLGDHKTRFHPEQVITDILLNNLPRFQTVCCGYFNTFAIDELGKMYAWGGGNLGQKNDFQQDLPRKIETHTEGRVFSKVMSISNSTLLFAQMRIYSIRPVNGPSRGGTLISLIGTGFVETQNQAIRFTYGEYSMEVTCTFDPQTDCFYCTTPKFEDVTQQNIPWPQYATVEITLDKQIYTKAEQKFQIYSSKIQIQSLQPKCASVEGGIQLAINPANLDQDTSKSLQYLTVGFQPKIFIKPQQQTGKNLENLSQASQRPGSKQISSRNQPAADPKAKHQGPLNPLDLSISDPELDKENWLCVNSEIINDQIICTIPKLENFHPDCLQFNVDISLNGQQFTGFPSSFRFYSSPPNIIKMIFVDIKIKDIYPKNGTNVGGTTVKVQGEGFFDTIYKKIKFISKLGERLIDVAWDKVNKQFNFVCPPLNWLLGSYEPTPEILTKVKEEPAKIYITFNQIEWIFIGDFSYIEPEIEKFLPVPPYDPSLTEEEKLARWKKPMEEIDPLKGIENEVELAKKKEELRKQAEIDEADINLYRKAGQQLFIIGNNFFQTDPILIQLTSPKKVIVVKGVFKNKTKIGFVIPELEELEKGIHEIQVEVSFNQQQFSLSQKKFKYLAFEPGMPEDQKKKFEDEILKAAKKPPAKK